MFTMPELATAVQFRIPIVIVLVNDGAYGNVRRTQVEDFGNRVVASDRSAAPGAGRQRASLDRGPGRPHAESLEDLARAARPRGLVALIAPNVFRRRDFAVRG